MKTVIKTVSFFIYCLLLLAAVETVLRLTPADDFRRQAQLAKAFFSVTKTHPRWGWAFSPHADTVWSYGLRESKPIVIHFRTLPLPGAEDYGMRDDGIDPAAKKKILVLGDSFTFGAAVELEDVWCERLERKFPGTDFINAAAGSGILKASREYADIGKSISHDAVIYALWMGNEFADNHHYPERFLPTSDNLHEFYKIYGQESDRFVLAASGKKAVSFFMRHVLHVWPPEAYVPEKKGIWVPGPGNLDVDPLNDMGMNYLDDPEASPEYREEIAETRKALADLAALTRRNGKPLFIFLLPFKEQVYFDLIPEKYKKGKDPQRPARILMDLCAEEGVKCFDFSEDIRRNRSGKIYWDYDVHFTPAGHAVTAEAAGEILLREKVLEK